MRRRALALALVTSAACGGCDGRPKSHASGASSGSSEPRHGPSIAVLDLTGGAPEIEPQGLFGVPLHKESFDRFVRAAGTLATDADVKGVFVRFGGASTGIARAQEIGAALAAVRKAGKPVTCHADGFTNATLFAAAEGCSSIWVSPAGDVEAVGIAAQVVYFHKLLADELHVTVDFLQVGKFKGAEESFTRDGPSDEARASLEGTLADLRRAWIAGLKDGRGKDGVEAAAEDGPYSPEDAKARGLIDAVGYADAAMADLKKTAGAVREDVRFGHGASHQGGELGDFVQLLAGSRTSSAPVALIRASGAIGMNGGDGAFGGETGITEREMSRLLARAEKDDVVKAVVLRVDSPGGSALASDLIWHEIQKVRAKKPVVVSVGGMAASGGYYISSAANAIVAEPTSILGSIGVVGGKLAFGAALERFGVHTETFPANKTPGAASRATAESALTDWDDPTRARILATMTSIYTLFLARVAEGRGTTPDKIAPFAEGRLFSGTQAKADGLVDELGGLDDAIAKARSLAKLPPDAAVETMAAPASFFEALGSVGGDDDPESSRAPLKAASAPTPGPADLLHRLAPDLVPFVASLSALQEQEHALTALPYALLVR